MSSLRIDDLYQATIEFDFEIPTTVLRSNELFFTSNAVHIGGYPWVIELRHSSRTGHVPYMAVYRRCTKSTDLEWSCKSTGNFRLIAPNTDVVSIDKQSSVHTFGSDIDNNKWGKRKFCTWADLWNYVKNGKVSMAVTITVDKDTKGSELPDFRSFLEADPDVKSRVLVMNGVRVHVVQEILIKASIYFRNLFSSDFKDHLMEEIPIEDVDPFEFICLLQVIYPSCKPISDFSVEFLLKLADRFLMMDLFKECEKYLLTTNGIKGAKKLLLVDTYKFSEHTKVRIMRRFNMGNLADLKETDEYWLLSNDTKGELLDML